MAGRGRAPLNEGDEILDIETTKITNVYESPRRHLAAPDGRRLGRPFRSARCSVWSRTTPFRKRRSTPSSRGFRRSSRRKRPKRPMPPGPSRNRRCRRQAASLSGMGEQGRRGRRPVVLIHGFGGDLNNWQFNQPALAEQRTYAIDLPGHGGRARRAPAGRSARWRRRWSISLTPRASSAPSGRSFAGRRGRLDLALNHRAGRLGDPVCSAGLGAGDQHRLHRRLHRAPTGARVEAVLEMLFADPSLVTAT